MPDRAIEVRRLPHRFASSDRRVMARYFCPGDEARVSRTIERVLGLSEADAESLLHEVIAHFSPRHHDIDRIFFDHCRKIERSLPRGAVLSECRRKLLGAYFTLEFAFESATLHNPSIVPAPDQRGMPAGSMRFLMSLRATGEGGVSTLVFHTGEIDADCQIKLDVPRHYARRLEVIEDQTYDKHTFWLKLNEMGVAGELAEDLVDLLPDEFSLQELVNVVNRVRSTLEEPQTLQETAENLLWLARSNYEIRIADDADPSEVVIFPSSDNETRGIEDFRFVRFAEGDSHSYYGVHAAYNGYRMLPQLIETTDFKQIRIHTLNGRYVQTRGLALFPRRIAGNYMMVSRLDSENLYLMWSKNIRFWNNAVLIRSPRSPWEFTQLGVCGSPIETHAGWLLLTYGVGPVRRHCIGATLLDLNDPTKVICQTREPLTFPASSERESYVPHVVHTSGAMVHGDRLVIPYAVSATELTFATLPIPSLLERLCTRS